MSPFAILYRSVIALAVAAALAGCGKKASPQATAAELQQSFKKAEAPVQQEVAQATAAVQNGNYAQAVITMDRVTQVQAQTMDEAQRKALMALIQQTRAASQKNPQMNSPELYKAMSSLVTKIHGEP